MMLLSIPFRSRDVGDTGLDRQTGMKPFAWAELLAISLLNASRVFSLFSGQVTMAIGCDFGIGTGFASYSAVPLLSVTTTVGAVSYLPPRCLERGVTILSCLTKRPAPPPDVSLFG
jgi:hypothetical protein